MRVAVLTFCLFAIQSCAHRSFYSVHSPETGGYSDEILNENIRIARYETKGELPPKKAELLSHFRAVEYCLEKGNFFARFWGAVDRSVPGSNRRTSFANYLSESYFTNPEMSYLGVFETSLGKPAHSRPEYFRHATYDTAFTCTDHVYTLGAALHQLKTETSEMVLVQNAHPAPGDRVPMQRGDIILQVGSVPIHTLPELEHELHIAPDPNRVYLTIERGGKTIVSPAQLYEISPQSRAFNRVIIKLACALPETRHRALCAYSKK